MIRVARTTARAIALRAFAAAAAMSGLPASGATYYIDFANGSDAASGLAPDSAWKRAPGDSRAGSGPRQVRLRPGDTLLFRGGVAYRGTITVRQAGSPTAPIRYVGDGWGDAAAILDGSAPVAAVRPCRTARDCGGAADWQGILRLSLSSDTLPWDGIFQQEHQLALAPDGHALAPGSARPLPGSGGTILLVRPHPGLPATFASGAGRVGFLLVAGSHVEIRGFRTVRFAPAPRFGPYAGLPLVQLQPIAGLRLTAMPDNPALRTAPQQGPAIAGVTSGPI